MNTSDIRDIALIVLGLIVAAAGFTFLFAHMPTLAWILFTILILGGVELAFAPFRALWNKLR